MENIKEIVADLMECYDGTGIPNQHYIKNKITELHNIVKNINHDTVLATGTFAAYLIMVGIRSADYTYTDEQLFSNTKYFRKCYNANLSAYKALLFLGDYIKGDYAI